MLGVMEAWGDGVVWLRTRQGRRKEICCFNTVLQWAVLCALRLCAKKGGFDGIGMHHARLWDWKGKHFLWLREHLVHEWKPLCIDPIAALQSTPCWQGTAISKSWSFLLTWLQIWRWGFVCYHPSIFSKHLEYLYRNTKSLFSKDRLQWKL